MKVDNYDFSSKCIEPNEDNYDFSSKCIKPNEIDFVIYHGKCTDGFTSAMCCWYWRLQQKLSVGNDSIVFYPAWHGSSPPDVTGKNVLMCDFSYKKDPLNTMLQQANKFLILDHHKTAQSELNEVPSENKVFDMDHCGAYITWRYFFGYDVPVPRMIVYVEDNDCWFKKQPKTLEFTSFIFSRPFEFEEYVKFLDDKYLDDVVFKVGEGMVIQNEDYKTWLASKIVPHFIQFKGSYYFAGHLSQDILRSELGNYAFTVLPYLNFSVMYGNNQFMGSTSYSLRSTDDRSDVSKIAKSLGGGGHRNAAGCGSDVVNSTLPCRVIDKYDMYYLLDNVYDVQIDGLNLIVFNNASFAKHMVKYLMQERTENVQEGSFILMTNKNNEITENRVYDAAVVFSTVRATSIGYVKLKNNFNEELSIKMAKLFSNNVEFDKDGFGKFDDESSKSFLY